MLIRPSESFCMLTYAANRKALIFCSIIGPLISFLVGGALYMVLSEPYGEDFLTSVQSGFFPKALEDPLGKIAGSGLIISLTVGTGLIVRGLILLLRNTRLVKNGKLYGLDYKGNWVWVFIMGYFSLWWVLFLFSINGLCISCEEGDPLSGSDE